MLEKHSQTIKLSSNNYQSQVELCLCLATLSELQQQMLSFLHSEELAHLVTLTYEKRQHSYLLGRYVAKQALSLYAVGLSSSDILIKAGIFEYPIVYYYSNERIQITLSHCQNLGMALAFQESCPVGVDLEMIQLNPKTAMDSILTIDEKRLINSYPYNMQNYEETSSEVVTPNMLYTTFWSLKEALSKVLRTGMMTPFEIYEIKNIFYQNNYWISEFTNFAQYQAMSFRLGQYVCSIVHPKQVHLSINIPLIRYWLEKTEFDKIRTK